MAIKTRNDQFPGLDTRINTKEIYSSSRLLSSVTGVQVQPNKAIVGANAFAHEAGIHQDGVLKAAITYEIMTPESIGRASNELVLGKHSGPARVSRSAAGARLRYPGRRVRTGLQALQGPRRRQEGHLQRGPRSDRRRLGPHRRTSASGSSRLRSSCGSASAAHAPQVRLTIDGESVFREASGVGPVDAIFKAISDLTETGSDLIQYQVHAVTAGLDAQGEVSVTIEEDGRRVIGNGVHEDVMVASAKAYVHALNKLEWHKQRRDVDAPRGI